MGISAWVSKEVWERLRWRDVTRIPDVKKNDIRKKRKLGNKKDFQTGRNMWSQNREQKKSLKGGDKEGQSFSPEDQGGKGLGHSLGDGEAGSGGDL